jgi:hypothetical protein
MALTAKQKTEVDNQLTQMLLQSPEGGIRALYVGAGQAGYAAMDALIVAEFSIVSDNLFNETPPTELP